MNIKILAYYISLIIKYKKARIKYVCINRNKISFVIKTMMKTRIDIIFTALLVSYLLYNKYSYFFPNVHLIIYYSA